MLASAPSSRNTGLIELISAYTGMGSGRPAAAATRAVPPERDPVKPTALIRGSVTSAPPSPGPEPNSSENVPSGRPAALTASVMARPTSSEVPGWASCALTTTGQPAARADAVSPPATENASGKLLAPNTATGPERDGALADVGPRQRRAVGQRGVDAGAGPAALAQDLGEQPQLTGGAADLAGDAAPRAGRLSATARATRVRRWLRGWWRWPRGSVRAARRSSRGRRGTPRRRLRMRRRRGWRRRSGTRVRAGCRPRGRSRGSRHRFR